jgi:hypothetical protein
MTEKTVGGKITQSRRTPEQRKAHAAMMTEAKRRKALLPRVYRKRDPLVLGSVKIPCAVVEDPVTKEKTRVVTEYGILTAIYGSGSAVTGAAKRLKNKELSEGSAQTPVFLADKVINHLFSKVKHESALFQKITYLDGGKEVESYNVLVFGEACKMWASLLGKEGLTEAQQQRAIRAAALRDALVGVALTGLVDDATGFQEERARGELAAILNKFLDRNLREYTAQFPLAFYQQLARLYKVKLPKDGETSKRPLFFAGRTLDIVYDRLAPDLVEALKTIKGDTKVKLHQALSEQHGITQLQSHLAVVVTLMELSDTKEQFYELLDRTRPRLNSNVSPEISRDDTL